MSDPRREAVDTLVSLLTLHEIAPDLFHAAATHEATQRLFGGQVVAQALSAATRSIADPNRPAHSLHAYFLRPGDPSLPVEFRVLRDFDGGSFANRRVVAMQGEAPILNLAASFHRREAGLAHDAPLPDVPPPESCPTFEQAIGSTGRELTPVLAARLAGYELRPVPPTRPAAEIPAQYLWFRLAAPIAPDPALARVVLTFLSDFALLTTSVLPHPVNFFSPRLQAASLDHAVWFHADPPVDDWLLYAMDSPWAGSARGFARGMVFDSAGRLVASVAQEGLIRQREPKA